MGNQITVLECSLFGALAYPWFSWNNTLSLAFACRVQQCLHDCRPNSYVRVQQFKIVAQNPGNF